MKKNVASQTIGCQMVSATDGSAFTGSVTVYVTGDAGTQAAGSVGSGACTHEGNGYHTYAPAQAETNYDLIAFTFIGTGAVPATVQVFTGYPQTGDSYARLGAPAGASVSADVAAVKAETAAIVDDTGASGVVVASGSKTGYSLAADQAVNATKIGGTTQTGRDLGASVLISSGTGTGQLDVTSGVIKANLAQILGTALTETAGQIAAAFKQFFNVASPTGTMKAITNVVTTTNLTNLPAAAATAAELAKVPKSDGTASWNATALAAINAEVDTALNTAIPGSPTADSINERIAAIDAYGTPPTVAAIRAEMDSNSTKLANLDATVSSRLATASYTAPPSAATNASAVRSELATELGRVDAAVSSRSSHSAADVWAAATRTLTSAADSAGVTTLLSRVVGTLATGTHNAQSGDAYARLGAPTGASVSADVAALTGYVDTEVAAIKAKTDNLPASPAAVGSAMALTSAYDAAKTAATQASVDDLPTNAELATALAGADDAVLAAVAALNNLSSAQAQTAAAAALTAYDPPTNAEMEARTLVAANYATAAALDAVDNYVDTEVAAIKAVTDKLDTALVLDGAVYQLTANALELAPTGGSAPSAATIASAVRTELATELGRVDAAVSSRLAAASYSAPPSASDNATAAAAAILAAADSDPISANVTAWNGTAPNNLDANGYIRTDVMSWNGSTVDEVYPLVRPIDNSDGIEYIDRIYIRDAMKLAPTAGAPAAGSVDAHLDDILENLGDILQDTGTTLPALIAVGVGPGSGTGYYTDTIDDGTNPLDGVRVQLYTGSSRVGLAYEAYTNALGVFEMWPDPGTYYRCLDLSGYSGTQDVEVVVTEP